MKRLFLLIAVCLIGMVVPQVMWAGVTIDTSVNGKVVVTSENAGDFATYLNSATTEQLNALKVNEIVFVGNFNESDLSTLQSKGCATQKKVDMEEAKFIKSASSGGSNYLWYESEQNLPNTPEGGKQYIVGGELWKKDKQNPAVVSWIPATEEDYNSAPQNRKHDATGWFDDSNKESQNDAVENGKYYKVPESANSASYVYYLVEKTTPLGWNKQNLNNGQEINDPSLFADEDEMNADTSAPDYSLAIVGGTVYTYTDGSWQPVSSSGDGNYDYTQMKFSYWGSNVEEIITSKYATGPMVDQLCNDCSNLKTLTLSAGDFSHTAMGNNINSLKTLNIKNQVTALGRGQFEGISTLSTVNFEETSKITLFPTNVFNRTGITSLTVPSSVQDIQANAFGNCLSLKTVTINENTSLHHIRTDAFQGSNNIEDVWVNVNPLTHPIVCEYHAFGEYSLVGQTQEGDLEDAKMATLHFNKDYWDYYAGDWKLGMTFNQSNLDAIKDGCNPNATGNVLIDMSYSGQDRGDGVDINGRLNRTSNGHVDGTSPANGWQQFARTSTGIDIIIPEGKFYRTYSTPSALVKPDWMKIYRVKDFNDGFIEGQSNASSSEEANDAPKKAFTEELVITVTGTDKKTYKIIPKNTGVIRVDVRDSEALYYFLDLERTSAASAYSESLEYPYVESGDKLNYMYPTKGEEVTIGPTEKSGNTITHRIFGLLKTTTSGVVPQFSRAKVGTKLGDHRAYLKLPASVFHWRDEKNGSTQDATGNDVVVDTRANAYSKISLFFDEDFEDLNGGIATAIINSIEEDMYKNDSFYTLQGVKVAKPTTKGVYIHNGKKILIK